MGRKKIPVRENTEIWKFYKNTGNLVCSSCKFPDSKGKIYLERKFQFSFEAGLVCLVSFVYAIVANDINWHREHLRLDRE